MGGDHFTKPYTFSWRNFNPHHPCGWWQFLCRYLWLFLYFNPHHPCGWWPFVAIPSAFWSRISIHTTRVGGDIYNVDNILEEFRISIHTTRVGGDSIRSTDFSTFWNFNPHHPCGWWLNLESFKDWKTLFQSTPPVWVVTSSLTSLPVWWSIISIHTTRVGGD